MSAIGYSSEPPYTTSNSTRRTCSEVTMPRLPALPFSPQNNPAWWVSLTVMRSTSALTTSAATIAWLAKPKCRPSQPKPPPRL